MPKGDPRAGFFGYNRNVTLADVTVQKSTDKRLEGTSYKMMVVETTRETLAALAKRSSEQAPRSR